MADRLSPMQAAFAVNYASGTMDATEAALRAGYSPGCARSNGCRLAKHPLVVAEVDRMRNKAQALAIGSKAEVLDLVYHTMQQASEAGDRTNVYKGAELWLKATGQLIEKQEIEQTTRTIEIDWGASDGGGA